MASTEFDDPRRKELLQALKDALPADTVTPTSWACLWLSDIDILKDLVADTKAKPVSTKFLLYSVETARIVTTWTHRKRLVSAASTPQNPSTPHRPATPLQSLLAQGSRGQKRTSSGQLVVTRSRPQRDLCHERDQKKCVLTKAGEPNEVAHIYPFSMRYENDNIQQQMPSFWDVLRLFWSKERVDAWRDAIFSDPARTEVCQNLLCLAPHAHAYWQRAYFALKPMRISDDKKCLDVQFFWLSSNPHVRGVDILQFPASSASDHGPNLTRLFNNETCTIIKSGDEISLKTDDPVLWPLPDFRLLEMQWFLHRLTAMSGAAETHDDFHDDHSDDDTTSALQDRWDMYTQDDWDMDIERETERFQEAGFPAQPFGAHAFEHMVTLRGGEGHREREEEGEDVEGEGRKGEEQGSRVMPSG